MRVNVAVRDGSIFENPALVRRLRAGEGARRRRPPARARLARRRPLAHRAPARARSSSPGAREWPSARGSTRSPTAATSRRTLPASISPRLPAERIATVVGRYYAMDRDNRAERTERALAAILDGEGERADDPVGRRRSELRRAASPTSSSSRSSVPTARASIPRVDTAIFFNFRPDRAASSRARLLERGRRPDDDDPLRRGHRDTPVAFPEQDVADTLAEVLSGAGIRQLHAAETEKYAHVTYFFNGGEEAEWEGETRVLVPSPRDVAELRPEAGDVGRRGRRRGRRALPRRLRLLRRQLREPRHGRPHRRHPGRRARRRGGRRSARPGRATRRRALGGVCLVTADHGNAEKMLEADGVSPHTAHTTNPVPLVVTADGARLRDGGGLADLAPTGSEPARACRSRQR